ncbi:hypothetical protein [Desulfatirhabdium butyrativorans]|uniref:hypothetical protein n=1 Tax=Desulfatirhabdium butyrativorans TaxID=340467 RepID=UPI001B7FCF16|nr:hypothetical protein [Desulfatirhabdium butyrativorans]
MNTPSVQPDASLDWDRVLEIDRSSRDRFVQSLPFVPEDAAAGVENELLSTVSGGKQSVDLPIIIRDSTFYRNLRKRVESEESTEKPFLKLRTFLDEHAGNVWENSWVRFPVDLLNAYALNILQTDMLADKRNPGGPFRSDIDRFFFDRNQEKWLRIPVSYFIKLGLAQYIGQTQNTPISLQQLGENMLPHFLSDNTSPETFSFYPSPMTVETRMGRAVAQETLLRHLLTHLLVVYGNHHFMLRHHGQEAQICFAPNPPQRLIALNNVIPDAFYRQLFMNPCLSGWDLGESKQDYMHVCHRVLSRSQLNAVSKLRDAGIIQSNLVVLPNLSNVSLANNGTHISISSRKLLRLYHDPEMSFKAAEEKRFGDLVIKIFEHFLPLFINTYAAAPYRLDFQQFHPEKALGFLPHELDFTHLRMLWRRWKKKARLKFFGVPVTPMGPEWLDAAIGRIFGLKGDLVPDFRLIDYLVALLSTNESPALDGHIGNDVRLKRDLTELGVFDSRMALYLFYRMRQADVHGFFGFEGRFYSLFPSLLNDMGPAASLQTLINALAAKYIVQGDVAHSSIPDTPFVESERRQITFGAAVGLPTFFVKIDTPNAFMQNILKEVRRTRFSTRYPGYVRVYQLEYRKALLRLIRKDAADLIELMQLQPEIDDLENRISNAPDTAASQRLVKDILAHAGASDPFRLNSSEFNGAAESYYRKTLSKEHLSEALQTLRECLCDFERLWNEDSSWRMTLNILLKGQPPVSLIECLRQDLLNDRLTHQDMDALIGLLILVIGFQTQQSTQQIRETQSGPEERDRSFAKAA